MPVYTYLLNAFSGDLVPSWNNEIGIGGRNNRPPPTPPDMRVLQGVTELAEQIFNCFKKLFNPRQCKKALSSAC